MPLNDMFGLGNSLNPQLSPAANQLLKCGCQKSEKKLAFSMDSFILFYSY